jgi:hypothetical protein
MSNSTTNLGQRAADRLTELAGSWLTLGWFSLAIASYIAWNLWPGVPHFDGYPFMFLTFCVSILANFQAIIVMISQKGQLIRDRKQQDWTHQILRSLMVQSEASLSITRAERAYSLTIIELVRSIEEGQMREADRDRVAAETLQKVLAMLDHGDKQGDILDDLIVGAKHE